MIEVEGLSYKYPGNDHLAVNDVSFCVQPGEIFGFLGPSGAGKSTTQKILTGLLKSYTGTVRILGEDLRHQGREYYERIGVGFELPNHFAKLSALENLRFFASFYGKTVDPVGLLARVGLERDVHQRVEKFSKGMKMRLCFVRALLHSPEVLFLDEPTSGLDPVNARVLKDMVVEQAEQGRTIFLTTHNMHDAEELCDRVAFLVDGAIKRIGAPGELRAAESTRRVVVKYRKGDIAGTQEFNLDHLGDDPEFIELLRQEELISIHSREPSLDDIFIATTGRRLE